MMSSPYIGVTGIVTAEDVSALRDAWEPVKAKTCRCLMAGVLVSSKTLHGVAVESRRYPSLEVAGDLLSDLAEFAWPVVHYNTRSTGRDLLSEMVLLYDRLEWMRGLQLNVVTPDRDALRDVRRQCASVEVILQVNRPSLILTESSPRRYATLYSHPLVVDHALLDLSGGTGREVSPEWISEQIGDMAYWESLGIRPGLAGGLGPGCGPLLERFADSVTPEVWRAVNVDAESRLRVPLTLAEGAIEGAKHQDRLCPDKVKAYLAEAVEVLG